MRSVAVAGVGICASGLPDWASARRVLAGGEAYARDGAPGRAVEGLPQTERRRINETSRIACLAARDALSLLPPSACATAPTVFASSDGDGVVLAQTLTSLAQRDIVVSPTAFHNSVYNAPAGYWSIAARSTAPSTTVCADVASLGVALLEAYAQATASAGPVLVVAVDAPFPHVVRALGASAGAFACALVLDGGLRAMRAQRIERWNIVKQPIENDADDALATAFAGNAAASALPLLRALAREQSALVRLPYHDGSSLELELLS